MTTAGQALEQTWASVKRVRKVMPCGWRRVPLNAKFGSTAAGWRLQDKFVPVAQEGLGWFGDRMESWASTLRPLPSALFGRVGAAWSHVGRSRGGLTGQFPSGRAEDRRLCGSAVGAVGLLASVRSRLLEMIFLRVLAWFPLHPRPVLGKQDRQDAGVEIDTRHQRAFALARDALAGRQCQCASAFGGQLHLQ